MCLYIQNTEIRLKKKGIRFSGHFLQKQMRRAGFFFYFLFPPKTNEATFFFLTQSNLTLNLNANRSGKNVSYAFFLGWDSLGMQLELAWALCLGLEQGSCSKLYVTPKCWDTVLTQLRYAVKIIILAFSTQSNIWRSSLHPTGLFFHYYHC